MLLNATVIRESALRYTPAGLPVLEMWLAHQSKQRAFSYEKESTFEIQAVLVGETACSLAGVLSGKTVIAEGFITQRSLKNMRLVLNIQHIEIIKGS